MISNAEYDYSNLNEKISGLMGALIGRGASEGDIEKLLKAETGQLAGRIGSVLGARTEAAAKRNATRDVAKQMTVLPGYSIFVDEDRQGHSANSDMEWLTASPQTLTGINAEDNRRDLDGPAAMELFRRAQKNGSRGKAAVVIGRRGHQKIVRVNRIRVTSAARDSMILSIFNRMGELSASFYRVAKKYVPAKRVPPWIERKFAAVFEKGKSSDESGGFGTPTAFVQFAVASIGIYSNPKIAERVQNVLDTAGNVVHRKLKNIVNGYQYDWETGRVFRPKYQEDPE